MQQCYFCQHEVDYIDYKDVEILQKFTDETHKIKHRKATKLCNNHQKELSQAIKRARQLGLMPATVTIEK